MTTLRDMPMITIEQKNRFREAALKVEAERDELVAWKDYAMRELTALQQVTHQLAHNGTMCWDYSRDARAVMDREPVASLSRRDARMKAEALEDMANAYEDHHEILDHLRDAAEAYRKQAEGEA
ncbi:hypothetical protein F8A90_05675 [Cobetia sp. cqz5-12]|uniref:hypothetical protein n=1 Tax=Cobetia sp. cqz5-12 TaxID=2609415 RepID=UPI001908F9F4|nr:hypothetical protein [Cobetia sp. cqz5-12]QQK63670.1 hypothetical protein F8A90_05675 [Cobetia sp. cqz5-12]